jgi:uncharacterized protein YacL
MLEKIYKISFGLFFAESILIIFGISIEVISYGIDIATPVMQIGIIIGLILGVLFRLILRKVNTTTKQIFAVILLFIYIFLCFYYLLEDKFHLILK